MKVFAILCVALLVRGELRKASQILDQPQYEDLEPSVLQVPSLPEAPTDTIALPEDSGSEPALPAHNRPALQTTTASTLRTSATTTTVSPTPATQPALLPDFSFQDTPESQVGDEAMVADDNVEVQLQSPPIVDREAPVPKVHTGVLPSFPSIPVTGGGVVKMTGKVSPVGPWQANPAHVQTVQDLTEVYQRMHDKESNEVDLHLVNPLVQVLLGLTLITILGAGASAFVIYALCLRQRGSYTLPPASPMPKEVKDALEEMEKETPLYVSYVEEGEIDRHGRTVPGSLRRKARVQRRPPGWASAKQEVTKNKSQEGEDAPTLPKEREELVTGTKVE